MGDRKFHIMGIVNVTPDSFSDGGEFFSAKNAVKKALQLIEEGAYIVDIGAESTRPYAKPISQKEEWERLEPVLEEVKKWIVKQRTAIRVSIDTRHSETMCRAIDFGVEYINHVGGPSSPDVLKKLAQNNVNYISMHMHFAPETMQLSPLSSKTIINTVSQYFSDTYDLLINCGFTHDRIWFDPGFGFGKTDAAHWELFAKIPEFSNRYQMMIGVSRKSWIGRVLSIEAPKERDPASKLLEMSAFYLGAKIIRTHDVKKLAQIRAQCLQDLNV